MSSLLGPHPVPPPIGGGSKGGGMHFNIIIKKGTLVPSRTIKYFINPVVRPGLEPGVF